MRTQYVIDRVSATHIIDRNAIREITDTASVASACEKAMISVGDVAIAIDLKQKGDIGMIKPVGEGVAIVGETQQKMMDEDLETQIFLALEWATDNACIGGARYYEKMKCVLERERLSEINKAVAANLAADFMAEDAIVVNPPE